MRTRRKYYLSRKLAVNLNVNGHSKIGASFEPSVRLTRLNLSLSKWSVANKPEKVPLNQTTRNGSKLVKASNRQRQTVSANTSQQSQPLLNTNPDDFVVYAIDVNKKCFAVKMFPTQFDPSTSTFDEYLTQSIEKALQVCDSISVGMCNVVRNENVFECDDVSPNVLKGIKDILNFEVTIQKFHVREKQLRDANKNLTAALSENQLMDCIRILDDCVRLLDDCIRILDEPMATLNSSISSKLIIMKQPRIVCTLLDLLRKEIDESVSHWHYIKGVAENAIERIKKIFVFKGSHRDFQKTFLLNIELFTKMTAHLSAHEKYELIADPTEVDRAEGPMALRLKAVAIN